MNAVLFFFVVYNFKQFFAVVIFFFLSLSCSFEIVSICNIPYYLHNSQIKYFFGIRYFFIDKSEVTMERYDTAIVDSLHYYNIVY